MNTKELIMFMNVKKSLIALVVLILLFFYFIFFFKKTTTVSYFKEGLAYDANNQLCTGTTAHYHDNGQLSSEATFEKGIRKGKWATYDRSGGIIQYGEDYTLNEFPIKELDAIKCERVEINKWSEGAPYEYLNIYIINPQTKLNKDSLIKLISSRYNYPPNRVMLDDTTYVKH